MFECWKTTIRETYKRDGIQTVKKKKKRISISNVTENSMGIDKKG